MTVVPGRDPRMNVGDHAERPDLEPVIAPMRFVRHAPIRCRVKQPGRIEWISTQTVLRIGTERRVHRRFKVKRVIDKRVRARTGDMRCKGAVDDRGGAESVTESGHGVRESPGRRGIPRVLNGGIVVGRNAVGNIERPEPRRVCIADVGVVPGPGFCSERIGAESSCRRRVVGYLRKRPDMIRDGAAIEEAQRRDHDVVIGIVRGGRRR